MLLATKANFSPIFLMFPDPGALFAALVLEAIGHPPAAQYTDDGGVGHRMWRVEEAGLVGRFQSLLGGVKSYIADGHHRHATALRYRDAVGPDGAWTLGYFTPIEAPGLVVEPYHRILAEGPSLEEAERRFAAGSASRAGRTSPPRSPRSRPRPRPTPSPWPSPGRARSWSRPSRGASAVSRPRPRPACARSTPSSCTTPSSGRSWACRTRR